MKLICAIYISLFVISSHAIGSEINPLGLFRFKHAVTLAADSAKECKDRKGVWESQICYGEDSNTVNFQMVENKLILTVDVVRDFGNSCQFEALATKTSPSTYSASQMILTGHISETTGDWIEDKLHCDLTATFLDENTVNIRVNTPEICSEMCGYISLDIEVAKRN